MTTTHNNLRLYYWVPRSEVVYIQAVMDAYEGLARLRTERHDGEDAKEGAHGHLEGRRGPEPRPR